MEIPRQDPDQLLRAIRNDTLNEKRGKLKIFFGYAAGVGKTYAMLQAAHQAKERGIDVWIKYITAGLCIAFFVLAVIASFFVIRFGI